MNGGKDSDRKWSHRESSLVYIFGPHHEGKPNDRNNKESRAALRECSMS